MWGPQSKKRLRIIICFSPDSERPEIGSQKRVRERGLDERVGEGRRLQPRLHLQREAVVLAVEVERPQNRNHSQQNLKETHNHRDC